MVRGSISQKIIPIFLYQYGQISDTDSSNLNLIMMIRSKIQPFLCLLFKNKLRLPSPPLHTTLPFRSPLQQVPFTFFSTEKELTSQDMDQMTALRNEVNAHSQSKNFSGARDSLIKIGQLIKRTYGEKHVENAFALRQIGNTYKQERNHDEAIQYLKKSLDIFNNIEQNFQSEKANILKDIGSLQLQQGDFQNASQSLNQAIGIITRTGKQSIGLVLLYDLLGDAFKEQENMESAIQAYEKSINILQKQKQVKTTLIYNKLAELYAQTNKYEQALKTYRKIYDILNSQERPHKGYIAITHMNLGFIHKKMNNIAEILSSFETALKLMEQYHEGEHPDIISLAHTLGMEYFQQNEYQKALPLLERCLKFISNLDVKENQQAIMKKATLISVISQIHRKTANHAQAIKSYELIIQLLRKINQNTLDMANTISNIGQVYCIQGNFAKGAEYLLKSLEIAEKAVGKENLEILQFYEVVAHINKKLENTEEFEKYDAITKRMKERKMRVRAY